MRSQPRLSKSRYITGLQCPKRLWLGWHDPEPRSEPEPGTILAVGPDVGVAARLLVPAGVLVEEGPDRHAEAVERTPRLISICRRLRRSQRSLQRAFLFLWGLLLRYFRLWSPFASLKIVQKLTQNSWIKGAARQQGSLRSRDCRARAYDG
jgi:hypothetical protein